MRSNRARLRAFLGGIGLGTSLLYDYASAWCRSVLTREPIDFRQCPLVGTGLTTTAKYAVVTKSPLTGFIADSLSSSYFALELKRIGIDALIITGRSNAMSYLSIKNQTVEIRSAEHLRGKSPLETESIIRAELNWPSARVAAIGRAGENLVRFATISNEGRHAGRGGVGAVMGAKNLKAIALSGDCPTKVADASSIEKIAGALRERSLSSVTDKYREIGTVANLSVFNRLGTLPTRNFQQSTFDDADAVSGESLTENNFSRRHGCAACTIRCERLFKALDGGISAWNMKHSSLWVRSAEFTIPTAFFRRHSFVIFTASTRSAQAAPWLGRWNAAKKDCCRRRKSSGFASVEPEGIFAAITAIAERRGIGALLAEGSRRAAMELGGDSMDWAMHVKGLELPGYEPRSLKTMALGLAVSPRGACHNRSGAYEADFSDEVDRFSIDFKRGSLVAASEDFAATLDSLIVCKFLRKCFSDYYEEAAEVLSKVTGWDYTGAELKRAGERIHNLKKLFNIREGWSPKTIGCRNVC